MTVLRLNTEEHILPRRRSDYAGLRRRGVYSVYETRQFRNTPAMRRDVIAKKNHPLPAFSEEGIRLDVLIVALALLLLLIFGVLLADISALVSGGNRVGRLNAGIVSLEESNSQLREQISRTELLALTYRKADSNEPEQIVVLSPAPME